MRGSTGTQGWFFNVFASFALLPYCFDVQFMWVQRIVLFKMLQNVMNVVRFEELLCSLTSHVWSASFVRLFLVAIVDEKRNWCKHVISSLSQIDCAPDSFHKLLQAIGCNESLFLRRWKHLVAAWAKPNSRRLSTNMLFCYAKTCCAAFTLDFRFR